MLWVVGLYFNYLMQLTVPSKVYGTDGKLHCVRAPFSSPHMTRATQHTACHFSSVLSQIIWQLMPHPKIMFRHYRSNLFHLFLFVYMIASSDNHGSRLNLL
jgi:hypothetical protein